MRRRLFLVFILIAIFALVGCKISGIITRNGAGLGGVTVVLSGDASMSTTTDATGTFVFDGLNQGTYTIAPTDAGYTFDPVSRDVTINYADVVGANFVAAASALPQWSTYQGNAEHTGYVPVSLNPANFSENWTQNLIESVALNPVTAGDGKVFVTTAAAGNLASRVLVVLDSATGATRWTYDFDDIDSINPPAYSNGTIYIQSGGHADSFLWAFDAESGTVLFQTAYGNQWARHYAPTIYDDNVYASGGFYGGAYGFDGITGEELWFLDLNQYDQWTPAVNEDHVIAYTGDYNPQLTVINRLTGEVDFLISDPNFEWNGWSMNLAPVLGSQNNVIAIHDGRLISFDLEAKEIGWETLGEKDNVVEGFIGQPSLANGTIYAFYEGSLQTRDEEENLLKWEWQPKTDEGDDVYINDPFPMIVTDNLIFVSTASKTYAVDLETKTEAWSYPAGGHLALSGDGVLFIATTEGNLIAISTIK